MSWHQAWEVRLLVHGDDFLATGPMSGLRQFEKYMKATYECKVEEIGVGRKDDKVLRVLGRIAEITEEGVTYEPDQRHVEAVCSKLGLSLEKSGSCTSPWEREAFPKGEATRSREARMKAGGQREAEAGEAKARGGGGADEPGRGGSKDSNALDQPVHSNGIEQRAPGQPVFCDGAGSSSPGEDELLGGEAKT
jgi:hypothetical protein